jgi:NAD(P)-dependent dehydrogenase (short-subunit alcohol dehydrogenase family)
LRDRTDDIRARGAELVIVGNGNATFASAFREDFSLDGPLLVDPALRAYRAAGLRRGRVEMLSPRMPWNALRALASGSRQTGVQGDPWQLGGVFVIRPDGALTYRFESREAGDHAPLDDVLAALAPGAPEIDETPPDRPLARLVGRALSNVLDPTIVASFDRTGFLVHALSFDPQDLDVDLGGRRCLVTGANGGLGFETSLALADLGARVVLVCRDRSRGEAARDRIVEQTGNRAVELCLLDVSDLDAIREEAPKLAGEPVDVLVHNAGALDAERVETAAGLERTLATHVVGPHLLTRLLRPAFERSYDARVVWVSSGGMYTRRVELEDPNWTQRDFDGVTAYAEAKRAQVILSELWAEAFRGTSVRVNAMHPGWADTAGVRDSLPRFHRVARAILRTPAEGADTIVWLAAAHAAAQHRGRFFLDRTPRRTHLLPFTRETPAERRELWRRVEAWSEGGAP